MDIRSYLKQGRPLLFDGAMGTYFAALPSRAEERCERACLTRPQEILGIHRAYLQAGCRAVKTNTFALGGDVAEGDDEAAHSIIDAACRLMQTSSMKLYEIAEAVGYHDHLQFNRAFRHEKGVPPSKYLATLEKEGPAAPQAINP